MPRSEISIELDNPKDYFSILDGEKSKGSKISMAADRNRLKVTIEAKSPKALIVAMGNVLKQVRIIEQTMELFDK